ncbi:hypothetical protein EC957_009861 [Mortierella hygrophila]|uniref:DNA-directed primase/polymerase protein n=1 Tax=Mortierella hygrophila TaxID=979708 RepID=A0A9P6EWC6_9FUNG|nr:hypothetical protein EC957_009861 [Mortierella hygrophila]
MEHKFESTYFRFKRAQDRCYEWGDENLHQFFVAIDGPLKYEYASYKDSTTFLKAYDSVPEEERYFFVQIRDGKACKEYYDIDWNLAYSPDDCEIKRQEQQVFNAFLNARNQHAPDYPLDATHCCVLSSSKNKKISLHIVIPTYVFENNRHMGVFVLAFKDSWKSASDEDSARSKRIDGGVYSRNRNMRILGSCKFKDTGRPLQRAHWHESSMVAEDEEFLITNPGPDSTRVSPIEYVKEPKKKVVAIRTGQIARTPEEDETELPQGVVDAVRALLMIDASLSHFEVGRFHGGRLQLMRTRAGHYRYLDYTKLYKNNKSLLICSEPDTGKTAFVEGYIKHHPEDLQYIFVSPRQSFSRNLEKRLVLENYLDFTGLVSGQIIVIQAESLARLDTEFYTGEFVLVLDEVCSVFSQMTSIATMGRHHRINNQLLESLMRRAKAVLALDADMTDREVEIIKAVRDDIWVIHNTFKPLRDHQVILYPTADMLETKVIDMINAGEKVWVTCKRSAEYAKSLHNTLKGMGRHGLCVTADTSESEKKRISQNINEVVRDLDYFIHTPTITVGIDCNVQHFDTVVGFFVAQSNVNVESCDKC